MMAIGEKVQIGDNKIKPNAKGSAFLIETYYVV